MTLDAAANVLAQLLLVVQPAPSIRASTHGLGAPTPDRHERARMAA